MSQGHCLGGSSRLLDNEAWGWGTGACCLIGLNLGSNFWLLRNDMTIREMSLEYIRYKQLWKLIFAVFRD